MATAHRRVLIRASDLGLLCCRQRNRLFQRITLNFSGRVSSFYSARAAGLLLRFLKRLVRVRHPGLIYVDDLLSLLNRLSSVIVVLLLCLRVPISWHKASLAPWYGMRSQMHHRAVDPSGQTGSCIKTAPSGIWSTLRASCFGSPACFVASARHRPRFIVISILCSRAHHCVSGLVTSSVRQRRW